VTRYMQRAAAFCLLLLIALLVNLTRVQVVDAPALDRNPANGRTAMDRSAHGSARGTPAGEPAGPSAGPSARPSGPAASPSARPGGGHPSAGPSAPGCPLPSHAGAAKGLTHLVDTESHKVCDRR
jgi:hypothetical protein